MKNTIINPTTGEELWNDLEAESTLEWDVDDSSDEEMVAEALFKYDPDKAIERYENKPAYPSQDPEGFSAWAHMVGVSLLYSPEVNVAYYEKKRELLGDSEIPGEEIFREWITKAVRATCREVLRLKHHSRDLPILQKNFFDAYNDQIDKTVTALLEDKRKLLKKGDVSELLRPLHESLRSFLQQADDTASIGTESFVPRLLGRKAEVYEFLYPNNHIHQELQWLAQQGLIKADWKIFPQKQRDIKKNTTDTTGFTPAQHYLFKQVTGYKGNSKLAGSLIYSDTLAGYKLEELMDQETNVFLLLESPQDPNKPTPYGFTAIPTNPTLRALYDAHPEILAPYIERTLGELKTEMLRKLPANLQASFYSHANAYEKPVKSAIVRKTLPHLHTFAASSSIENLANLRLSNRSQRRTIRQMEYMPHTGNGKIDGETVFRGWKFGDTPYDAVESQTLSTGEARTDLVENLGNYKSIAAKLTELREKVNKSLGDGEKKIADATFARAIMDIVKGKTFTTLNYKNGVPVPLSKPMLTLVRKYLINTAYLLFGTEVVRNPASLVMHTLLLDLVSQGREERISWIKALSHEDFENHFGGGVMPMSMGSFKKEDGGKKETADPVPSARQLQETYQDILPWPYKYPGSPASNTAGKDVARVQELVKRESDLSKSWVEKCAPDAENTKAKRDRISARVHEFFGIK